MINGCNLTSPITLVTIPAEASHLNSGLNSRVEVTLSMGGCDENERCHDVKLKEGVQSD